MDTQQTTCSCEHCFKPAIAKNLCDTHYRRFLRHGSTQQTRPTDWGLKEKHPLYDSWMWVKRMRNRHTIQEEWLNFWNFVQDLGERPSPRHRLYKIDPELGYTRGNLVWKETLADSKNRNEYAKAWRKANPDKVKNSELKKQFGISLEEYQTLLKQQDYSCAICKTHTTEVSWEFAVDHCHTSGKVRGLLCNSCNLGLGHFKDQTDLLKQAITYLGE